MTEVNTYRTIVTVSRVAALVALIAVLYIGLFVSKESFRSQGSAWPLVLKISLWVQGIALVAIVALERKKRKGIRQPENVIENE